MEIYVGTSGWVYDWNPEGKLDWYVKNSGLNAVELNASFYRFPYPSQVKSWRSKGSCLRWSIKVHNSITHLRKLSEKALETWQKFYNLFKPMDDIVDFYLFQMPPNFSKNEKNIKRVIEFFEKTQLGQRFAIEFRHKSWFNDDTVKLFERYGLTLVSIDAPIGTWIVTTNGIVYLRVHGRSDWYAHDYSREELMELAEKIMNLSPRKVYVFFNNDHWMLNNAREMLNILRELTEKHDRAF
ncbi:MAG: DUF72 domain-containing protein [Crenarchaeota archaeon]|nr:DUF72 domain-containing protein [Thermoproteota archaeon]